MQNLDKNSDTQLLEQMQADVMLAFDAFYRKYYKRVFQFAYSILKSKEDAENIVHEVFIKFWENRKRISSARPYLFEIAYNTTISLLRKKITERQFIEHLKSLPVSLEAPVNTMLEYTEIEEKSEKIINTLPARQKEVYLLSRQEELTYPQIAERMHISVNTVENHMARALKTIRKQMGPLSMTGLLFISLFL